MNSFASFALRAALATVLTALLLGFLVFARWLDARQVPELTIRVVETTPPVALPAPPPPPEEMQEPADSPPPPPPEVELPQLDLQIEAVAPPLAARLDPALPMAMETSSFDLEVDPVATPNPAPVPTRTTSAPSRPAPRPAPASVPAPVARASYDAGELDAKPHLVNRPSAAYPRDQLRAGVREGKVLLEVAISTSGNVTVRRVIASSHADFTAMAREFAGRARFSVPRKDGQPVTAIYRWPLILRP